MILDTITTFKCVYFEFNHSWKTIEEKRSPNTCCIYLPSCLFRFNDEMKIYSNFFVCFRFLRIYSHLTELIQCLINKTHSYAYMYKKKIANILSSLEKTFKKFEEIVPK